MCRSPWAKYSDPFGVEEVSNASVAGTIVLRYRKGMDTILYSPETAGLPDIVSNPEIMFGTHCVIHRKAVTADAAFSGRGGPVTYA